MKLLLFHRKNGASFVSSTESHCRLCPPPPQNLQQRIPLAIALEELTSEFEGVSEAWELRIFFFEPFFRRRRRRCAGTTSVRDSVDPRATKSESSLVEVHEELADFFVNELRYFFLVFQGILGRQR